MKITLQSADGEFKFSVDGALAKTVAGSRVLFSLGYVVLDGKIVPAESERAVEALLDLATNSDAAALSGSFAAAFVLSNRQRICAVTDVVGSHPMYYAPPRNNEEPPSLVLGVDPTETVKESAASVFNRTSIGELLCFGYPLAASTLFEGLFEVPPATRLCFEPDSHEPGRVAISEQRYWSYEHSTTIETQEAFSAAAEEMFETLRHRYLDYAERLGLTCLVKLTAGADSRLLLSMFCDYSKMRTATYGYRGYRDVYVARSLSRQLSIPHTFAPLSGREALSEGPIELIRRTLGVRSMPYIGLGTDVVLRHAPQSSYIHLPGHSGEVPAGSHIRAEHLTEHSRDDRLRHMREFHSLIDKYSPQKNALPSDLSRYLASDRSDRIIAGHVDSTLDTTTWLSLYQWDMFNRQSKHILSDALVLRDNGPVFLPYWDLDFLALFQKTSVGLLFQQKGYKAFAKGYTRRRFGDRVKIEWPINHHVFKPILREAISSRDLVMSGAYVLGLARQITTNSLGISTSPWGDRYVRSIGRQRIAEMCREAMQQDEDIREALTLTGRRFFQLYMPRHVVELKVLLDSWRTFLSN